MQLRVGGGTSCWLPPPNRVFGQQCACPSTANVCTALCLVGGIITWKKRLNFQPVVAFSDFSILKHLRLDIAIVWLCWQSKPQGEGYEPQVQQREAITDEGECYQVSFGVGDKHFDENHIQDDPLHQHPHEGHQEEVVEENSHNLAVDGDRVAS